MLSFQPLDFLNITVTGFAAVVWAKGLEMWGVGKNSLAYLFERIQVFLEGFKMIDEEWEKDPELNEKFKELASLNLHDFKNQDENGLLRNIGFVGVQRALKKAGMTVGDLTPSQLLLLISIQCKHDHCRALAVSENFEKVYALALWPHLETWLGDFFLKFNGLLMIDFNKTIEKFIDKKLVNFTYQAKFKQDGLQRIGLTCTNGTLSEVLIELAGRYDI